MLWGLPRVGGTKNPDVSRVLDLAPELVFANEEENRIEDVRAIEAAGVAVDVTFPKTVEDAIRDVRRFGDLLGDECAGEAEALAGRIEAERVSLEGSAPPRPFLYACWIWKDPWMTVSDDTYVADLLRRAGGVNVFGRETDRYPSATPEEAR